MALLQKSPRAIVTRSALLVAAGVLVLANPSTIAQPDSDGQSPPSQREMESRDIPVYLKFTNAATGAAVKPSELIVNRTSERFTVEAQSLVVLSLPAGQHQLEIRAEGYATMEATITVAENETPVMTFELDPATAEEAPAVEQGHAVIEGHVTDADTGALIEKAFITLPDAGLSTTTDSTGRFAFELIVPRTSDENRPAVTLEARADDYRTLRIKNLALAEGERRKMPLTLERMTSETTMLELQEIDEAAPATTQRNFDWVFDVTIR